MATWVSTAACRISLAAASGVALQLQGVGFSLQSTGSRRMGFGSCGPWAACGIFPGWASNLHWQMSPALAGRFLTTGHQGSPLITHF